MNNFSVIACDTDSIFFKKPDETPFLPEEIQKLNTELNSLYPETIHWELNDYFSSIVTTKAKNYVLKTSDGKIKIKGSALKATGKEIALKEFLQKFLELLLEDKQSEIPKLYLKYVKEIMSLKEMSRWSAKKTVTDKVLNPERTNEQRVLNAIDGEEGLQEGDKIRVFFRPDGSLCLAEHFDGIYDAKRLLKKLYDTAIILQTVYPVKENLLNYSLKRNDFMLQSFLMKPRLIYDQMLMDLERTNPELYKLATDSNSLPGKDKVFRAFTYKSPRDIKVIILGQDPYPNPEDACGLAFSVEHEDYPPSLKNIFKELQSDLGIEMPRTGNLEPWAEQGVLLLNSILTTEKTLSLTHSHRGWEEYTTKMIQKVLDHNNPVVIIAWGKVAQNKVETLKLHEKVLVLTGKHPSPLSQPDTGFFGGNYFSKTNEFLKKNGVQEIDWTL